MFLARQHGFSDEAQAYLNTMYATAFNAPDAPERLAQATLSTPTNRREN